MMKTSNLISLIWLQIFATTIMYGQNFKTFSLVSQQDSTSISYAHIFLDDKLASFTDELGTFKIDLNSNFKTLKIKHIAYQTMLVNKYALKNISELYMRENENFLDEVLISINKNPKHFSLLPEKSGKEYFMKSLDVTFPYDVKNAVYIPNQFKNGVYTIKNILFETRKGQEDPDSKYIPFMLNLMTVDSLTLLPKDKIFSQDLAVGKKENQKLMKVDVSSYDIEFPKNGIFIVVSLYDKEYYESNGFIERPGFGQTQIAKNSKFFELFWLPGRGVWDEPSYSKNRIQCRNFGLEVIEN